MKNKILNHPMPTRQRGIVIIAVVLILIAAVVFALSQTLSINGTGSLDNKQQLDSSAALYLAESGLEKAQGTLKLAPVTSNVDSVCTGITEAYALGRGRVDIIGAPTSCSNTANQCTRCSITSTGSVGLVKRTINRSISNNIVNGTAGAGPNATMVLKNTSAFTAVALFNLATRLKGGDTETLCNTVTTTNGGTANCALRWNLQSKNGGGTTSVGGLGVSVVIPANDSATITQTLNSDRNYAEVGIVFPGNSAPSVVGSFWDDTGGGGLNTTKTIGTFGGSSFITDGATNNGSACATNDLSCPASTTPKSPSVQASKSWCYGADTLAFGFSGRSWDNYPASLDNQLSNVTFGTSGSGSNALNIPLARLASFPNSQVISAPGDVFSEIWYVYNQDYLSTSSDGSSGGSATGTIGASVTGAIGSAHLTGSIGSTFVGTGSISGTVLKITSVTSGSLAVGNVISGTGVPAGTTITPSGPCTSLPCTYNLSTSSTLSSRAITVFMLTVTNITSGSASLAAGNVISGTGVAAGTTITSFGAGIGGGTGNTGNYNINIPNIPQTVPSTSIRAGSGTLLNVTAVAGVLNVGDPISGTGITAGTTIAAFGTGTNAGTGGIGTYTISAPHGFSSNPITAANKLLNVTKINSGFLSIGDTISGSGISAGTVITSFATGSGTTGTYNINMAQTVSPEVTVTAVGKTIHLPKATGSTAPNIPNAGTIVKVRLGSGQFNLGAAVTGSISGTTMTVTANSGSLNIGDRLFGIAGEVASGTTITAGPFSCSPNNCYTVSISQTVPSITIYARPAVIACNNVSNCFSGTGSISAFSGPGSIAGSVLTITTGSSGALSIGSVIQGTNIAPNTKIIANGTGTGGTGTYTISPTQTVASITSPITITANTLNVTALAGGALSEGDTLTGTGLASGTFIASLGNGGAGTYNILPSQTVVSATITAAPSVNLFAVSKVPVTQVSAAQICGGICAFFNNPTTTLTNFTLKRKTNTGAADWSAGFMCLSGADVTPTPIVSSAVTEKSWSELVQ